MLLYADPVPSLSPPPRTKVEAGEGPLLGLRIDVLPIQTGDRDHRSELVATTGGLGVTVDLLPKKDGFRRLFPPEAPARLALEAQPDTVSEEEFAVLYPVLVRLAGTKIGGA